MKYISAITLLLASPTTLAVPFLINTSTTKQQKENWAQLSDLQITKLTDQTKTFGISSLYAYAQTESKFYAGSLVTNGKHGDDPFYCTGWTKPHMITATLNGSPGQLSAGDFQMSFKLTATQLASMIANPMDGSNPTLYYTVPKSATGNEVVMENPWINNSYKKLKNISQSYSGSAPSGAITRSSEKVDHDYQSYGIQAYSLTKSGTPTINDYIISGSFQWEIMNNSGGASPFPVQCEVIATNPANLKVEYEFYPYNYQIGYHSGYKQIIIQEIPYSSRSYAKNPTLKLKLTYYKNSTKSNDTVGKFEIYKEYDFYSGYSTLVDSHESGNSEGTLSLYGYSPTFKNSDTSWHTRGTDYKDAYWQFAPTLSCSCSVATLPQFTYDYSIDNPLDE